LHFENVSVNTSTKMHLDRHAWSPNLYGQFKDCYCTARLCSSIEHLIAVALNELFSLPISLPGIFPKQLPWVPGRFWCNCHKTPCIWSPNKCYIC